MVLRKSFEWMDECQKTFQDLKIYLTMAPLLSLSILGEELYLYLEVTPYARSSTLIREEGRVQKPIYYTSRVLRGAEGRYPMIEKLAFCANNNFQEVETLLPSSCHQCHDSSSAKKGNEQAGSYRTTDPMGC